MVFSHLSFIGPYTPSLPFTIRTYPPGKDGVAVYLVWDLSDSEKICMAIPIELSFTLQPLCLKVIPLYQYV